MPKILVAIPHYSCPEVPTAANASRRPDPRPRINALREAIAALNTHFGRDQRISFHDDRANAPANQSYEYAIDVFVCCIPGKHVLDHLALPSFAYQAHYVQSEPSRLGFTCHALLRDHLGRYDYYCYIEDDIVIHDPLFFDKISWFVAATGPHCVLQPKVYETSPYRAPTKYYVDGDNPTGVVPIKERIEMPGAVFCRKLVFRSALNAHSCGFFLNEEQMRMWVKSGTFLDGDTGFVGPLESAATFGLLKNFVVFKPGVENAAFLEVQHYGALYLEQFCPAETAPDALSTTRTVVRGRPASPLSI